MNQTATESGVSSPPPSAGYAVLVGAFFHIFSPAKAARRAVNSSPWGFFVFFAGGLLLYGGTVTCLLMWDLTVERTWAPPPITSTGPTSRPIYTPPTTRTISFAEVWQEAHAGGTIGDLEFFFLGACALAFGAAVFSAWLLLPVVYGGGSGWAAFRRTFRAVASGFGVLWSLTILIGGLIVLSNNLSDSAGFVLSRDIIDPYFLAILFFGSAGSLVYWLNAAARGVAQAPSDEDQPPRCESCGYDLTDLPMEARCPECGMIVAKSLVDTPRRGCAWQLVRSPGAWLQTVSHVAIRPADFYNRLRLRDDVDATRRFARAGYPLIGMCAAVWFFLMFVLYERHDTDAMLYIPLVALLLFPILSWMVHRFIGAMAASWWIVHGILPDSRWGETVIRYESAFLWAFCAFDGILLTSYWAWGKWISRLARDFGMNWISGISAEILAILVLNGSLCCLWLYRYHIAAKAVRWSNF